MAVSPPVTPPQRLSLSSDDYNTPATSCFDSPTSLQCSPNIASHAPSPNILPYRNNSDIEKLEHWQSRILESQSRRDTAGREISTSVNSARKTMSDGGPFHIFGQDAVLKLGNLIGSGQWSNVYDASLSDFPTGLQASSSQRCSDEVLRSSDWVDGGTNEAGQDVPLSRKRNELFAAKVGSGKWSIEVLQNEARILSVLMARPFMKKYAVEFFGYNTRENSLVLENIPLNLENFVADVNSSRRVFREFERFTKTISQELIEGLHHIHSAGIIHADIKPSNILLRRGRSSLDGGVGGTESHGCKTRRTRPAQTSDESDGIPDLRPVYCDFSAARFDNSDSIPNESAGTYDFMAPELFSRAKPQNYPTQPSDVYALGVTLIYVVIGKSPYDTAQNVFMGRAMAMAGTPLNFIDMDDESALKWERSGFGAWVKPAVQAKASERWTAQQWSEWAEKRCAV